MQYTKKNMEKITLYGISFFGLILYAYVFMVGIKGVSFFASIEDKVISPIYIIFLVFFILYYYEFNFLILISDKKNTKRLKSLKKIWAFNSILNILWLYAWMYKLFLLAFVFSAMRLYGMYIFSDLINKSSIRNIKKTNFSAFGFVWASIIFMINFLYLFVDLRVIFGYDSEYFVILFLSLNFILNLMYYFKFKNKKTLAFLSIIYISILVRTLVEYKFHFKSTYIFEIIFIMILVFLIIRKKNKF